MSPLVNLSHMATGIELKLWPLTLVVVTLVDSATVVVEVGTCIIRQSLGDDESLERALGAPNQSLEVISMATAFQFLRRQTSRADRKSTRLNSSHWE